MHSSWGQTWESEWNWSNVWNASRTTYGKEPVNDVVPPISLFIGCSCMFRFDLSVLMEHVVSSKSISLETLWKHNFWHSRSSDSWFDPSWFLERVYTNVTCCNAAACYMQHVSYSMRIWSRSEVLKIKPFSLF